jgi:putative salt-induced outer membrane protein
MIKKILFLSALAVAAMAAESELVTHSEFSYINTKGNTDTSSLAFEGLAKKNWDKNFWHLHADIYQSSENGTSSKDKWSTELNYDYQFDEVYSFNYLTGYKQDRFSGFDYQLYTGPGIGVKAINTPMHKLSFQTNILYEMDKPENMSKNDYASGRFSGIYEWKIQDNLKFIQEGNYRTNLENFNEYFLYSKTAIETKISSNFSMGAGYKVDYVNTPPSESKHTDRTFLASFIIDY